MATHPVENAPDAAPPFWSEAPESVLARLSTSPGGLTAGEAAERRKRFGPNRPASSTSAQTWRLALRQLENPLVLLLLGAALISWSIHERDDAILILVIVAASALVGFWQERSAGAAVRALLRLVAVRTTVLRDGRPGEVPVEDLVPGDIVHLSAGSLVPGDARILQSRILYVDEASLTGESFPSEKRVDAAAADAPIASRCSALYSGTHVISGSATAVIVATGSATEFGHVMERLRRPPPTSGFERGLQQFGTMLVKVTIALVVVIFALAASRHHGILEALMFALAISVGMTPELLPAIVTINLARGARRMAAKRVIVKRLAAIENFGSMTVLCADKTGTLTEGTVQLSGAWSPAAEADAEVLELAAVNAGLQSGLPSPIDDAIRAAHPLKEGAWRKIDEIPYDFSRKRLSVLADDGTNRGRLITKGALAGMLEVCRDVRIGERTVPLDEMREQIEEHFDRWSTEGMRVLGVAVRDRDGCTRAEPGDEAGMTLVGFLTLTDVPKPGVGAAIERLRGLGITLKIITGDNRKVAAAVATLVGLPSPRILAGDELRRLSPAALVARALETDVFAEVEPNQKERIIAALQRGGEVVGFLGDGINDAPALHAADVGISVESAVDVAKEAAEIVLLDRDLDVLVDGVMQGRITFENTLKYIYITISANFGNMLSMAAAASFLPFLPLLPAQILLNNFLSDFPAMTIGGDHVDPEAAARPGRWDIGAIRSFMFVFGAISSAFDFLTFGILILVLHAGAAEFQSAWFLVSLLTEVCILLVMRTKRSFVRSRPSASLLVASLATALAAVMLVVVPSLAAMFDFVPLKAPLLVTLIAITAGYVVTSEVAKLWFFGRISHANGDRSG